MLYCASLRYTMLHGVNGFSAGYTGGSDALSPLTTPPNRPGRVARLHPHGTLRCADAGGSGRAGGAGAGLWLRTAGSRRW